MPMAPALSATRLPEDQLPGHHGLLHLDADGAVSIETAPDPLNNWNGSSGSARPRAGSKYAMAVDTRTLSFRRLEWPQTRYPWLRDGLWSCAIGKPKLPACFGKGPPAPDRSSAGAYLRIGNWAAYTVTIALARPDRLRSG